MTDVYDFSRCPCSVCTEGFEDGEPQKALSSEVPTPWAVICPKHGMVFYTSHEYNRQMMAADCVWSCPKCGLVAKWNDANYDRATEIAQEMMDEEDG